MMAASLATALIGLLSSAMVFIIGPIVGSFPLLIIGAVFLMVFFKRTLEASGPEPW